MRFTALLIAALVGANLIAAFLFAHQGTQWDRLVRMNTDVGRLVSLLSVLEALEVDTGASILSYSSTRFTAFSLEAQPIAGSNNSAMQPIHNVIVHALPEHVAQVDDTAACPPDTACSPLLMVFSVQIARGQYIGQWLNSRVYPLPPKVSWERKTGFFIPLLVSLGGTLIVGLIFIRRMTAPLRVLTRAVHETGRGNWAVSVPETGASELQDIAVAFNAMQRRIAEFDAERIRMLAAIGHDLRTPITTLRLRSEMVADSRLRTTMNRNLHQMTVIVDDLLLYARNIQSDNREPLVQTDLTDLLRHLSTESGARFDPAPAVEMQLRPVALSRVVGNLIDNAMRYADAAEVGLTDAGDTIVITVRDDGPGVAPDLLDQIFHPFVRGESSRSAETGGIGLGLAIAQSIAQAQGWRLDLANRPEGGLIATVRLSKRAVGGGE
ncbi:MAG TPA: ATP-binding protein [Paenirhodobacter sp.]